MFKVIYYDGQIVAGDCCGKIPDVSPRKLEKKLNHKIDLTEARNRARSQDNI